VARIHTAYIYTAEALLRFPAPDQTMSVASDVPPGGPLMRLDVREKGERMLPQGCQITREYDDREWRQFLQCAKVGFESGELLDKEFYAKVEGRHGISERTVRRAIWPKAKLVAYLHGGHGRVALWDGERTGLLVIARESSGKVFNAYEVDDFQQVLRVTEDVRWLRR
jgi:hypothetical protein